MDVVLEASSPSEELSDSDELDPESEFEFEFESEDEALEIGPSLEVDVEFELPSEPDTECESGLSPMGSSSSLLEISTTAVRFLRFFAGLSVIGFSSNFGLLKPF